LGLFVLLHIFYFFHPVIDHVPFIFVSNTAAIAVLAVTISFYKLRIVRVICAQFSGHFPLQSQCRSLILLRTCISYC
jgi:hypothetical protein